MLDADAVEEPLETADGPTPTVRPLPERRRRPSWSPGAARCAAIAVVAAGGLAAAPRRSPRVNAAKSTLRQPGPPVERLRRRPRR